MPDGTQTPAAGHNRGPHYDEALVAKLTEETNGFLDAAGTWLDNGEIDKEADAERLNDFIKGLKKRRREIDTARSDAKRPHDDAGKAVQAAFKPVLASVDKAVVKVEPLLTAFLQKKQREKEEAAKAAAEAARKAEEEAQAKAAKAASRNDVAGEAAAEAAQEEAEQARKEADRAAKSRAGVSSATGGARKASLRRTVHVDVINPRVAFMHFAEHTALLDCLTKLAEAEARAKDFDAEKDTIPGCKIRIEERAV